MSLFGGGSKKVKPTQQERALAEVGAKDFNDQQQYFVPAENQLRQRLEATDGDISRARGRAAADVQQSLAGAPQSAIARGIAAGINQNSSRAKLNAGDVNDAAGTALGDSTAQAEQAREDVSLRGRIKLASFGRGLADTSRIGTAAAGQQQTRENIAKLDSKLKNEALLMEGIGGALGGITAGVQLYKEFGGESEGATR